MDKDASEIQKLKDRISKDPKSKLFVPLAEEYKKVGDMEMAITVLSEGLNNNPGYLTAKSLLGRLLLEKGDLAGAQKELSEVVKAIPDNLMAQRKLGDIYAHQSNLTDALKHYKMAQSLNPKDEDIASLISHIESGRDISQKIPPLATGTVQKPIVKTEPASVSPSVVAAVAAAVAAPVAAAVSAPVTPPDPIPADVPIPTQELPAAAPDALSDSAVLRTLVDSPADVEEAEEVFIVEPLESEIIAEAPVAEPLVPAAAEANPELSESTTLVEQAHDPDLDQEPSATGFDFLSETDTESVLSSDSGSSHEETAAAESPFDAMGGFEVEPQTFSPAEAASPPMAEPVGNDSVEETPKDADDFSTDTLAELYISQGFFEKAIDIYERMLSENPHSQGLKEKLKRVRSSLAEQSAASAAPPDEIIPVELSEEMPHLDAVAEAVPDSEVFPETEATEYVPPPSEAEQESAEELLLQMAQEPVAREYVPPPSDEAIAAEPVEQDETPAMTIEGALDQAPSLSEDFSEGMSFDAEFKPVEYVPQNAEPAQIAEETLQTVPKASAAGRKETIDRLENWLNNIMKEK